MDVHIGYRIIAFGAIAAALSVAIGAFGAHGLEGRVDAEMLVNYETGARYHFYHSLGMLAIGLVILHRSGTDNFRLSSASAAAAAIDPMITRLRWSAALMLTGIVLFSGSLYTMALTEMPQLGAITPFGGAAFVAAWVLFAWAALDSANE